MKTLLSVLRTVLASASAYMSSSFSIIRLATTSPLSSQVFRLPPLLVCQPSRQLLPRSTHRPVSFLRNTAYASKSVSANVSSGSSASTSSDLIPLVACHLAFIPSPSKSCNVSHFASATVPSSLWTNTPALISFIVSEGVSALSSGSLSASAISSVSATISPNVSPSV